MRRDVNTFDFHPSLLGTMSVVGGTYLGAVVDRMGFRDVTAVYTAGAINSTNFTGPTTIALKVQESAIPEGTGANWSDITNGAINGSFSFATLSLTSTNPILYMDKKFENFADANRKRYIRLHATVGGTTGLGATVCGGFILGGAQTSAYVQGGATQGTGNPEYFIFR